MDADGYERRVRIFEDTLWQAEAHATRLRKDFCANDEYGHYDVAPQVDRAGGRNKVHAMQNHKDCFALAEDGIVESFHGVGGQVLPTKCKEKQIAWLARDLVPKPRCDSGRGVGYVERRASLRAAGTFKWPEGGEEMAANRDGVCLLGMA
jgi:hypothetical protein